MGAGDTLPVQNHRPSAGHTAGRQQRSRVPFRIVSRAAVMGTAALGGRLCCDVEVNEMTSAVKPCSQLHLRESAGALCCRGQGTL
jgi:hypothetical protein